MNQLKPVTTKEVLNIIARLCNSRAGSWDEIPQYLIKRCARLIAKPLVFLTSMSFKTRVLAAILKFGNMITMCKGGDACSPDNYSPVFLLHT